MAVLEAAVKLLENDDVYGVLRSYHAFPDCPQSLKYCKWHLTAPESASSGIGGRYRVVSERH